MTGYAGPSYRNAHNTHTPTQETQNTMTQTVQITVVTKPLNDRGIDTCVQCAAVKRKLTKLGAEFETIYTDTPEGHNLVEIAKNEGIMAAPLVIVKGEKSTAKFGGNNLIEINRLIVPFVHKEN